MAYWGQNGGNSEKELNYYCTNSAYDTVVIGFVDRFEHPENKGKGNVMHIKKYPIKKSRNSKCQVLYLNIERHLIQFFLVQISNNLTNRIREVFKTQ